MPYGGGVYAGGLRRSFQWIIRGHYSYATGYPFRGSCQVCLTAVTFRGHDSLVKGNPLKLLKNTLATKHNRNDNDYHLHLQQNICPTFKLSFSGHSKAPTMLRYPLPYTALPRPLSTLLMGLYVPLSHCLLE